MKFKGKKAIMAAALSAIVAASSFVTAITASAADTYRISNTACHFTGKDGGKCGETRVSKEGASAGESINKASAGDVITVTATPYPGHYISHFSVYSQDGYTIYETKKHSTSTLTYTFTMPARNVAIETTYGTFPTFNPNPTPSPDPTPTPTWRRGDVNLDGYVNAKDATAVLKHIVGLEKLTGQKLINADVNGDGFINAKDATEILKIVIGLA